MLFKPLGTSRLQRVQGAYVTEEEIALVVEQCRAQREQELDESLLEAPEAAGRATDGDDGEFDPDEDPLLDKAIEIVVQTQTASVSLLQRRLRVGYTRAGRLIDMLERRGIISGYEGSKPRRVLVEEHHLDLVLPAPSRSRNQSTGSSRLSALANGANFASIPRHRTGIDIEGGQVRRSKLMVLLGVSLVAPLALAVTSIGSAALRRSPPRSTSRS